MVGCNSIVVASFILQLLFELFEHIQCLLHLFDLLLFIHDQPRPRGGRGPIPGSGRHHSIHPLGGGAWKVPFQVGSLDLESGSKHEFLCTNRVFHSGYI